MSYRSGICFVVSLGLFGCSGPKLYVEDLVIESFDGTTLKYTAVVSNSSGSSTFCRSSTTHGPITLQAWSTKTQDLLNDMTRRPQGGWQIVGPVEELAPGGSLTVTRDTGYPLIPGRDVYLFVQVYTGEANPTFPNPADHEHNSRCKRIVVEKSVLVPYGN